MDNKISFMNDFEHLRVQLKDIRSATNDFCDKPIGIGGFGKVYKGELSFQEGRKLVAFKRLDRKFGQGDTEFWKEIMMLSQCRHQNLISLLHFCDDDAERILVYEYANGGSLDRYLGDTSLTWTQRLKICLGAANGLKYLHDPNKIQQRVLHRDIKSSNILLDEKLTAKLSDFGLSKIGVANLPHTYAISNFVGTLGYCDPLYLELGLLSKESDVYSFGVVLFEVMCGRLCYECEEGKVITILVPTWKNCYDEKRLNDILFPDLKGQIDENSLKTFSAIAYRCLNIDRKERPTMDDIIKELEAALEHQIFHQDKANTVTNPTSYKSKKGFHHLKIRLKDIASATQNFDPNKLIRYGGFGPMYKGELSLPEGRTMFVCKRLDRRLGQGNREFWMEITMLSKYRHENLVSLMHFCDEGDERIIVYDYLSRGSLDQYLSDTSLTWVQRLKICIGVARALNYLHDPKKRGHTVLHQDLKSSTILLDEKWTAKLSDFGLSKIRPSSEPGKYHVLNVVGTPGYFDPSYWETGLLSKESDVYSFGVVLFEIICGRVCYEYNHGKLVGILVNMWRKCYDANKLDEIISPDLKKQMEKGSLNTFSSIAYRCLKKAIEERPTMDEIVNGLEYALNQQVAFEERNRMVDLVVPPILYTSQDQLHSLLLRGIPVAYGKTWLSLNKDEKTCETISATTCISGDSLVRDTVEDSRFMNVLRGPMYNGFRVQVKTKFLSFPVTYSVNLVFKHNGKGRATHLPFRFKVDSERHYSNSYITHVREDGWLIIELLQFTSYRRDHSFQIEFLPLFTITFSKIEYFLEGVEFRPVEYLI